MCSKVSNSYVWARKEKKNKKKNKKRKEKKKIKIMIANEIFSPGILAKF